MFMKIIRHGHSKLFFWCCDVWFFGSVSTYMSFLSDYEQQHDFGEARITAEYTLRCILSCKILQHNYNKLHEYELTIDRNSVEPLTFEIFLQCLPIGSNLTEGAGCLSKFEGLISLHFVPLILISFSGNKQREYQFEHSELAIYWYS